MFLPVSTRGSVLARDLCSFFLVFLDFQMRHISYPPFFFSLVNQNYSSVILTRSNPSSGGCLRCRELFTCLCHYETPGVITLHQQQSNLGLLFFWENTEPCIEIRDGCDFIVSSHSCMHHCVCGRRNLNSGNNINIYVLNEK